LNLPLRRQGRRENSRINQKKINFMNEKRALEGLPACTVDPSNTNRRIFVSASRPKGERRARILGIVTTRLRKM
jgi:hypothetical protein